MRTHLEVNGNKGPGIHKETIELYWEKDIMLGDQSFGHPVMSEIAREVAEQAVRRVDKQMLEGLPTEVLEKIFKQVQEELERKKIMAKEKSYGIAPYVIMNGYFFVLLNKTSRTSYYNFFKGKEEDNESKKDTAVREFFEETGIQVEKEDLEDYFEQKNPRKDIGIFLVDFTKYNHLPFKFEENEIYSAIWVNVSKDVEMSKNQKKIYGDIMLHFKPKLKQLRNLYFPQKDK